MPPALLDTDTLSEVIRARNARVLQQAREYLEADGSFTFSIITRYEVLRGLEAEQARRQIAAFEQRCRVSTVLPLTDEIVVRAARIYGDLHRAGRLIDDADILIATTALAHDLTLVTDNRAHFERVPGLRIISWAR